jgi:hypothetical protein
MPGISEQTQGGWDPVNLKAFLETNRQSMKRADGLALLSLVVQATSSV